MKRALAILPSIVLCGLLSGPTSALDSRVPPGTNAYKVALAGGGRATVIRQSDPAIVQQPETSRLTHSRTLSLTVNSAGDEPDADLMDGVCSVADGGCTLRAAIEQVNSAGRGRIGFAFALPETIYLTGGALFLDPLGEIVIDGPGTHLLTIRPARGSRVFISAGIGSAVVRGMTIEGGETPFEGGCIFVAPGSSLVVDHDIIQNCVSGFGGGISSRGSLLVSFSTVRNNTGFLGGGIFIGEEGNGTIVNSSISDNIGSQGGGINNNGDLQLLRITNSTFSGNLSREVPDIASFGGGIFDYGPLVLTNVTLAGNSAEQWGGGIADFASVWGFQLSQIRNTIVATNTAGLALPDVYTYGLTSNGSNLVGIGPINGMTNGINHDMVGKGTPIDPGLATLAERGGFTATRALLRNSRARDAGDNCVVRPPSDGGCLDTPLFTDQRGSGYPRRARRSVDIGAYESGKR